MSPFDVRSISDIGFHRLMGDRWKGIISGTAYLRQPAQCVFSGGAGPVYQSKALVLFEFCATAAPAPPPELSWLPTLLQEAGESAILVDCLESRRVAVRRLLTKAEVPGVVCWTGPTRSLCSGPDCRRVCFRGYLCPDASSDLHVSLTVRTVKGINGLDD